MSEQLVDRHLGTVQTDILGVDNMGSSKQELKVYGGITQDWTSPGKIQQTMLQPKKA